MGFKAAKKRACCKKKVWNEKANMFMAKKEISSVKLPKSIL